MHTCKARTIFGYMPTSLQRQILHANHELSFGYMPTLFQHLSSPTVFFFFFSFAIEETVPFFLWVTNLPEGSQRPNKTKQK